MTGKYATATDVPSARSKESIERTITRYGAHQFITGWTNDGYAMVGFAMNDEHGNRRQVRFVLAMPDRQSKEFTLTPTRRARSQAQQEQAYKQAVKQRWRALDLIIKAKLEAVEIGVVEWSREFGPHVVLPGGSTVGDHIVGFIDQSYALGAPAPMLAIGGPE